MSAADCIIDPNTGDCFESTVSVLSTISGTVVPPPSGGGSSGGSSHTHVYNNTPTVSSCVGVGDCVENGSLSGCFFHGCNWCCNSICASASCTDWDALLNKINDSVEEPVIVEPVVENITEEVVPVVEEISDYHFRKAMLTALMIIAGITLFIGAVKYVSRKSRKYFHKKKVVVVPQRVFVMPAVSYAYDDGKTFLQNLREVNRKIKSDEHLLKNRLKEYSKLVKK